MFWRNLFPLYSYLYVSWTAAQSNAGNNPADDIYDYLAQPVTNVPFLQYGISVILPEEEKTTSSDVPDSTPAYLWSLTLAELIILHRDRARFNRLVEEESLKEFGQYTEDSHAIIIQMLESHYKVSIRKEGIVPDTQFHERLDVTPGATQTDVTTRITVPKGAYLFQDNTTPLTTTTLGEEEADMREFMLQKNVGLFGAGMHELMTVCQHKDHVHMQELLQVFDASMSRYSQNGILSQLGFRAEKILKTMPFVLQNQPIDELASTAYYTALFIENCPKTCRPEILETAKLLDQLYSSLPHGQGLPEAVEVVNDYPGNNLTALQVTDKFLEIFFMPMILFDGTDLKKLMIDAVHHRLVEYDLGMSRRDDLFTLREVKNGTSNNNETMTKESISNHTQTESNKQDINTTQTLNKDPTNAQTQTLEQITVQIKNIPSTKEK